MTKRSIAASFDQKVKCVWNLTKRSITASFDQKVKCVRNLTKRSIAASFDQKPLGPTLRELKRQVDDWRKGKLTIGEEPKKNGSI